MTGSDSEQDCKLDPGPLQQALARAEALCKQRGTRLTAQRRRVLELVLCAGGPVGAYDILHRLREGTVAAPPTVYRALDFLLEQGLIHKLETLHAYIGCPHPEHHHDSQFLICDRCGEVLELENAGIAERLDAAAAASGFAPQKPVVEILGTCATCGQSQEAGHEPRSLRGG